MARGAASAPGETTVTLADHTVVVIRPITPEDAPALVAFHRTLSEETIYLRYFSPHPVLSLEEVERFTHVDGRDRVALVAEVRGRLVGVGRYDRVPSTNDAEVAFVITDQFQHHGLGAILLRQLSEIARQVGITHLVADVLSGNTPMLSVFFDSGFVIESQREYGSVNLRMAIGTKAGTDRRQ